MTKFEVKDSANYAAQIVRLGAPFPLPNADRLEGFGVLGYTVIGGKGDFKEGELAVFFPAESQVAHNVISALNLYRHGDLNKDQSKQGYIEDNRRVRALKLRGTVSNGMLIPLGDFAAVVKVDVNSFAEGQAFDTIDGLEISRKYRIDKPVSQSREKAQLKKAFKRIENANFPIHIETDQYLRNSHLVNDAEILIVTQKLHGTSFRAGRLPVHRQLRWYERALQKVGIKIQEKELDTVFGSRQVVKDINNPRQNSFYGTDLWTSHGKSIEDRIPANVIIYGELVGWVDEGQPIQKGHTYQVPEGEAELYVYRVAILTDGDVQCMFADDPVLCAAVKGVGQ